MPRGVVDEYALEILESFCIERLSASITSWNSVLIIP